MTKSMMSIRFDKKEDEMQEQFTKQAKEALEPVNQGMMEALKNIKL